MQACSTSTWPWSARASPGSIFSTGCARAVSQRSGLDAADDVGGTWYWNRYPGARCDVQTLDYTYTFDPELEKAWTWSEKYATQPEILRYLGFVADRYDLRRDIRFGTSVTRARWNEGSERWLLDDVLRSFRLLPPLRHGDGLPLVSEASGNRRRPVLQGRNAHDRPLAARRRRSRRQARRGHRHRLVGYSAHPDRRRAGGRARGVPADSELRPAGPQRRALGRSPGAA